MFMLHPPPKGVGLFNVRPYCWPKNRLGNLYGNRVICCVLLSAKTRPIKTTVVITSLAKELSFTIVPHARTGWALPWQHDFRAMGNCLLTKSAVRFRLQPQLDHAALW